MGPCALNSCALLFASYTSYAPIFSVRVSIRRTHFPTDSNATRPAERVDRSNSGFCAPKLLEKTRDLSAGFPVYRYLSRCVHLELILACMMPGMFSPPVMRNVGMFIRALSQSRWVLHMNVLRRRDDNQSHISSSK